MDLEKLAPFGILIINQVLNWFGARSKQTDVDAERDKIFNDLFIKQQRKLEDLEGLVTSQGSRIKQLEDQVEQLKHVEQDNIRLTAENTLLKQQLQAASSSDSAPTVSG